MSAAPAPGTAETCFGSHVSRSSGSSFANGSERPRPKRRSQNGLTIRRIIGDRPDLSGLAEGEATARIVPAKLSTLAVAQGQSIIRMFCHSQLFAYRRQPTLNGGAVYT